MSTLTKLFVVLQFVCALLLSAAMVVFANRVEDFRALAAKEHGQWQVEHQRAERANGDLISAKSALKDQIAIDQSRLSAVRGDLVTAQGKIADLNVQINRTNNELAARQADVTRLSEALKASEHQNDSWQAIIVELRAKNDDLVNKYRDANITITEITSKLDSTERQRRWLDEQLKDANGQIVELNRQIALLGGPPTEDRKVGNESVPINAVVKDIAFIGGAWHATISVGSAENVYQGMKFNAVNRDTGDFLGILTIESLQLHESIGRLEGPKLKEIKVGTEVRTQL